MPTKGRHKNIRTDDRRKNTTLTPDGVKCTKEELLEITIRKKLDHLYGEALSRLVREGYDEDVALKGLLEMGYCFGEGDCLSNVVHNSLQFLTGKDVESEEEEDRPQPFRNLELLVEFNLYFLVYILQKYRPNLNRISIRQCILMTDLNFNLAISMNINDMPFVVKELPSDLNLDDDDGDSGLKDRFLALEIREMLNSLNVLDDSVSEDMKDTMIADLQKPMDDLEPQFKERIRWAGKKVAQARRKQPTTTTMSLGEEFQVFEYFLENMLAKRKSELSSFNNELDNVEKTKSSLVIEKEEIKAEISASKLIVSETRQKCLEVSKKGRQLKNWEKQKVKLQGEIELEKEKISKWEQQLVEIMAAIVQAQVKLDEVTKTRKAAVTRLSIENQLAINCWKRKVEAIKLLTDEDKLFLMEQMERLKKLVKKALIDNRH